MQDFRIDDIKAKPPDCSFHNYIFIKYSHVAHIIMEDLNIIDWKNDRIILAKGPKYHDPQSINWKHIFNLLINPVEGYVRKLKNWEKEEDDTILKWVKTLTLLIRMWIKKPGKVNERKRNIGIQNVAENLSTNSRQICFCFAVPAYKDHDNIGLIWKQILHWLLKDIVRLG